MLHYPFYWDWDLKGYTTCEAVLRCLVETRDALEASKEVVGVHGVFNMTPTDHFGLDDRSRVLIRIEGGAYKLVAQ